MSSTGLALHKWVDEWWRASGQSRRDGCNLIRFFHCACTHRDTTPDLHESCAVTQRRAQDGLHVCAFNEKNIIVVDAMMILN